MLMHRLENMVVHLQAAASNGNIQAIRLLLGKGADVNAQSGIHGGTLQVAATLKLYNSF